MTTQEILSAIEANEKQYAAFGIRGDSRLFSAGEELPCSQNMVDALYDHETKTYPLLDGTCAVGFGFLWFDGDAEDLETIEKAVAQCREYGYENMYLIAGYDYHDGDDDGEIVLVCAEVICKI